MERGERRLRSPLRWVFCFPLKGGCAHSLNMSYRTTPQILGRSQVQQNNYFQDSGDWKALWIADDHHKLDVATMHLLPLEIELNFIHFFLTFSKILEETFLGVDIHEETVLWKLFLLALLFSYYIYTIYQEFSIHFHIINLLQERKVHHNLWFSSRFTATLNVIS